MFFHGGSFNPLDLDHDDVRIFCLIFELQLILQVLNRPVRTLHLVKSRQLDAVAVGLEERRGQCVVHPENRLMCMFHYTIIKRTILQSW